MPRTPRLVGVAFFCALLLAPAAQLAAQDADPPPAVAYRQSIMRALASHSSALQGILADGAGDPTHILNHATALVQLSLMAAVIFEEGTGGPMSRARDEIWQNAAEFQTRLEALQDASSLLLQAARAGVEVAQEAGAVRQTCGGCHRQFRSRQGG